jgi:hypothetical protein
LGVAFGVTLLLGVLLLVVALGEAGVGSPLASAEASFGCPPLPNRLPTMIRTSTTPTLIAHQRRHHGGFAPTGDAVEFTAAAVLAGA